MWNWTAVGLIADFIGFIIIALEWHRTFKYTEEIRQNELQDAYERNQAREEGREPEFQLQMTEETMAREFSKLRFAEAVFRERLFFFGVGLILLGFVFQLIGVYRP